MVHKMTDFERKYGDEFVFRVSFWAEDFLVSNILLPAGELGETK